jgi:hypothetical protein
MSDMVDYLWSVKRVSGVFFGVAVLWEVKITKCFTGCSSLLFAF